MVKPRLLPTNGRIAPSEDARVHVLSTAMKYAASVYEAMRAYWSDTSTRARDDERQNSAASTGAAVPGENLAMLSARTRGPERGRTC